MTNIDTQNINNANIYLTISPSYIFALLDLSIFYLISLVIIFSLLPLTISISLCILLYHLKQDYMLLAPTYIGDIQINKSGKIFYQQTSNQQSYTSYIDKVQLKYKFLLIEIIFSNNTKLTIWRCSLNFNDYRRLCLMLQAWQYNNFYKHL